MRKFFLHCLVILLLQLSPSKSKSQNVGIGTTTPGYILDVNGRMRVKSSEFGNIDASSGIWMEDYRDGENRFFLGMRDSIRFGFYGAGTGSVGWGLNFNARTGNVGIGISAPAAQLHIGNNVMIGSGSPAIGFALSVNGKIISEELKVQLVSTWPDYVFDKSYDLPAIDEMKDYISLNKHLKNIPSAKDVKDNGLMVGDMQKRMMEKIEELSLYIIQLNDRLKLLEDVKK